MNALKGRNSIAMGRTHRINQYYSNTHQEKVGHINSFQMNNQTIDLLPMEWYEARKRSLKKQTSSGKEVSLKFLNENPELTEGDILYANEITIILVSILPCNCIVMKPKNMFEIASVCYEIGNKHLSLFYEADQLLVPFEIPLYNFIGQLIQGMFLIKLICQTMKQT